MKHQTTLAIALAATFATGCMIGSAKIRSQDQQGGVLVLEGDENKAMQDAQNKMGQHCGPGNYQIVKRETVKVGEEQYANSNTAYDERTDRARDEDTASASASDTTVTHDSASRDDGWGNRDSASDTTVTHDSASATSTSEDETTVTQGGKSTSSVQGRPRRQRDPRALPLRRRGSGRPGPGPRACSGRRPGR